MASARGERLRLLAATATIITLALGASAGATDRPRYDVPAGFTRCPTVRALGGFFKWASVRNATCGDAGRFVRSYAARESASGAMPHRLGAYRCRIHYWRNADGDVYASRHTCRSRHVTVRFYGMV